jgi:hypothetical protein
VIRRWNLRTPGREDESADAAEAGQPALADTPATGSAATGSPVTDAARPDDGSARRTSG